MHQSELKGRGAERGVSRAGLAATACATGLCSACSERTKPRQCTAPARQKRSHQPRGAQWGAARCGCREVTAALSVLTHTAGPGLRAWEQARTHGWTDTRTDIGWFAWGSRAPHTALAVPGAPTEGGVTVSQRAVGTAVSQSLELCPAHSPEPGKPGIEDECNPRVTMRTSCSSLGCLPGLMSQHELRWFVVREVSKGFRFLFFYFLHCHFSWDRELRWGWGIVNSCVKTSEGAILQSNKTHL